MTGRRHETGLRVRREVLGDEHVDRATAAATDFDRDFQRWITERRRRHRWNAPADTDRGR